MTTILDLSSLSNDAFDSIVNQDVRGTLDSGTSKLLREPTNLDRWYDTLLSMKRTVEAQLAADRAELTQKQIEFLSKGPAGKVLYLQEKAKSQRWRQSAIRFKNGVEDTLSECKRLRSAHHKYTYMDVLVRERDRAMREALIFRTAITSHRQRVDADDADDTHAAKADEELWKVVDSAHAES